MRRQPDASYRPCGAAADHRRSLHSLPRDRPRVASTPASCAQRSGPRHLRGWSRRRRAVRRVPALTVLGGQLGRQPGRQARTHYRTASRRGGRAALLPNPPFSPTNRRYRSRSYCWAGRYSERRRVSSLRVLSAGDWRWLGLRTPARSWLGSGLRCMPPSL